MKTAEPTSPDKQVRPDRTRDYLSVPVRQLISFAYRDGGLSPMTYGDLSGLEGTRIHQNYFKKLESLKDKPNQSYVFSDFETEHSLSGEYTKEAFTLRVRGRADLIMHCPDGPMVVEVKSFSLPTEELNREGDRLHWAQAEIYAYLLARERYANERSGISAKAGRDVPSAESGNKGAASGRERRIRYALDYVSANDTTVIHLEREKTYDELERYFEQTCAIYLDFARNYKVYLRRRDADLAVLRFPYPTLRDGQREFMKSVLKHLRSRTPLLVQAPTGTGKTMSTLYPSLKALGQHWIDRVFYFTAKTSTRAVAEQALEDMRRQGANSENAISLRSLTLSAKEKICLAPQCYCDVRICPYAVNYYKNLETALLEALALAHLDAPSLQLIAEKHRVCPFELSLDVALYCDVIIGDYNHAFDPRVRLERFFSVPDSHHALLIDEAHNLPDRSREMFSAELRESEINAATQALDRLRLPIPRYLPAFQEYCRRLREGLASDRPLLPDLEEEIKAESVMIAPDFRADRTIGPKLLRLLRAQVEDFRALLDEPDDPVARRPILDLYFNIRNFLKVADEYYNERYVFAVQREGADLCIRLLCLDASDRLIHLFRDRHATIFFSATLSPMDYFAEHFCGSASNDRPDYLVLHSPFPAENRAILAYLALDCSYKGRQASLPHLVAAVRLVLRQRPGRYLLFFPSYAYLEAAAQLLQKALCKDPVTLIQQQRSMTDSARSKFLRAFDKALRSSDMGEADRDRSSLLGLAILGGVFGEGIDLKGERLNGVIIVGMGIPQLSPERELLRAYFDARHGNGYAFAYQFPGFNKVMQAAGRLIRSEEDKGLILFMDERYERPEYLSLFPEDWDVRLINDARTLAEEAESAPDYHQN